MIIKPRIFWAAFSFYAALVMGFQLTAQASIHSRPGTHQCGAGSCEHALGGNCGGHGPSTAVPGNFEIIGSGQNEPQMQQLREAATVVYHEACAKLGITIPPSIIRFMNATDMAALANSGGHPAPHFHDGANVIQGARSAGGILEFVTPGASVHHQFIRDTNNFHDTLLVLAHVAGHYDFAEHTPYFKGRDPDQVKYSYELANLMSRLYTEYDHDQVAEYYQRLLSLQYLQDITRGSFESPATFSPQPNNDANATHPSSPSESVLQAYVANLPATTPTWQRDMATLFERLHRTIPAYMQTKIMNEGWATFLEYIILAHTKWNTSDDALRFGQLNAGVRVPGLSNPYWMGAEAWIRLWVNFRERPEIRTLPNLEQDRRFIQYAHSIIETKNDYSFLQMALDETWINRMGFFLKRPLTRGESPAIRRSEDDTHIAITRNPRRIVNWIARKLSDRDLSFPKIQIVDFNHRLQGGVLLRHNPVLDVPLQRDTLSKTLFELSQLFGRPVTIETVGTSLWYPTPNSVGSFTSQVPRSYPLSITVNPRGEVAVTGGSRDVPLPEKLQKDLQENLQHYRMDVSMTYSPAKARQDADRFRAAAMGEGILGNVIRVTTHAPTAGQAIDEYLQTAALRLEQSLRLAAQGQWPIDFLPGGKKVRIRVLPEIPHLELDQRFMQQRRRFVNATKPEPQFHGQESNRLSRAFLNAFGLGSPADADRGAATAEGIHFSLIETLPDEDLDLGQGKYLPGESFNEEKDKEQQGEGEGEGEGEPQDGEPGEPQPGQGGQGGGDPSVVEIPIEMYGEILAQEIELRNMRKTIMGENPSPDETRIGSIKKPHGNIRWDRTAEEAYALGLSLSRLDRTKKKRRETPREILMRGLRNMTPSEIVVADREPEPNPEVDAVIVWVRDTSGSMDDEKKKIISNYVANTRALLKTKYPFLKERFVIYSDDAKEATEKEFFSLTMSGGTNTLTGIKKAEEILESYPHNRFNRFSAVFSDGDDFGPEGMAALMAEVERLVDMCEHTSYGHVEPDAEAPASGPLSGQLSEQFRTLSQRRDDVAGFAVLNKSLQSIVLALKDFYGKKAPK